MSVTIDMPPGLEASLSSQAQALGMPLEDYVRGLLANEPAAPGRPTLSGAERAAMWRAGVEGLPRTPPLADDAIDRSGLYDTRG
jgi:hypothetical protein